MPRWHRPLGSVGAACVVATTIAVTLAAQQSTPVASFAEPGISPDRTEIAFVSGGDIWTVPITGGVARLLVSHPATESRPLFSPDGRRLAFVSTRTGGGDVYVLTFASGEVRRVTFDDLPDQLDAWSPDGRWLYFSSSSREIAGMNDVFRVSADGGTPMPLSADRYTNEYWARGWGGVRSLSQAPSHVAVRQNRRLSISSGERIGVHDNGRTEPGAKG